MEEFKATIQKAKPEDVHVLYFGAEWCKNCVTIKNELKQIIQPNVYFYDVDEHEDVTAFCGVTKLPTIQIWKDAKNIEKYEGAESCNIALIIQKNFTNDDIVEFVEDF